MQYSVVCFSLIFVGDKLVDRKDPETKYTTSYVCFKSQVRQLRIWGEHQVTNSLIKNGTGRQTASKAQFILCFFQHGEMTAAQKEQERRRENVIFHLSSSTSVKGRYYFSFEQKTRREGNIKKKKGFQSISVVYFSFFQHRNSVVL